MAGYADDGDVGAFPGPRIEHVEGVALCLDTGDHLLARPRPGGAGIAELGDVLVRALGMRFCNTGYLYVCHRGSLRNGHGIVLNYLCGRRSAARTSPAIFFRGSMSEVAIFHRIEGWKGKRD
jgi:hypothetical protein